APPPAADDGLLAPRDAEEPPRVDAPEIAGAEPPVRGERVGVLRGVDVAEVALGTARQDLALVAGSGLPPVVVHEAHLHRADWAAVAVDAPGGRVARPGGGDRRKL